MRFRFLTIIAIATVSSSIFAAETKLVIRNDTPATIFAAVYCKTPKLSASKSTNIVQITPSDSAELDRTSSSFTCRRQLVVSKTQAKLIDKITDGDFYDANVYGTATIGTTSGDASRLFHHFYVRPAGTGFEIDNTAAHGISKVKAIFGDIVDAAVTVYKNTKLQSNPAVANNVYADKVAQMRHSNTLPDEERAFLARRMPKVKAALEKMFSKSLNGRFIPKISFIASGGGARAMVSTVGWHAGAEQLGLLDALTYDVGLSGGTWGIGFWMSSGLPITSFKTLLKSQLRDGILPVKGLESGVTFPTADESKLIVHSMFAKLSFDQPWGLVDFYGSLLANRFLNQKTGLRQVFALHDLQDLIKNGDYPMPIFTAINADDGTHEKNRHLVRWIEFTPYEVGASWLGGFVPSWAYGRAFADNQSVDFAPAQSFGFQTGTYGSAFAFDFRRGLEEVLGKAIPSETLRAGITYIIEKLSNESAEQFGSQRLSTAKVNNFAKESPGADADVKTKDVLRFADGGLAFNLPYPPVSGERPERAADVLIFLDASGSLESEGTSEFKLATEFARSKDLKLPKINFKDIEKKDVSVFIDENDPSVPVVIYLPRKLNETKLPTLKFVYSDGEFESLVGKTEAQMVRSGEQIKQAIKRKIELNGGF